MATRKPRTPWILALLPLLASGLITACSGVLTSDQPSKRYYTLMPLTAVAAPAPADAPMLAMALRAVPGLDSDRIQALGPDASIQRYANARWPDHLPEVLSSVLRRSLENSGRFAAVTTGARPPAGAWTLELEVQQFYGLRSASAATRSVIVEIAGDLACENRRERLRLEHSAPVGEERLAAVVAAHQAGLDSVTRQLLALIESACFDPAGQSE